VRQLRRGRVPIMGAPSDMRIPARGTARQRGDLGRSPLDGDSPVPGDGNLLMFHVEQTQTSAESVRHSRAAAPRGGESRSSTVERPQVSDLAGGQPAWGEHLGGGGPRGGMQIEPCRPAGVIWRPGLGGSGRSCVSRPHKSCGVRRYRGGDRAVRRQRSEVGRAGTGIDWRSVRLATRPGAGPPQDVPIACWQMHESPTPTGHSCTRS
jgi:hypothetical protein